MPARSPAPAPITLRRLDVAHWHVTVPDTEPLLAAEVDWWASALHWAGTPGASALLGYIVPMRTYPLMVEGIRALGGNVRSAQHPAARDPQLDTDEPDRGALATPPAWREANPPLFPAAEMVDEQNDGEAQQ